MFEYCGSVANCYFDLILCLTENTVYIDYKNQ